MKRALYISLLVGSVATPNFAADGDGPAIRKREFRSLEATPGSVSGVIDRAADLSRVPVSKALRSISPLTPSPLEIDLESPKFGLSEKEIRAENPSLPAIGAETVPSLDVPGAIGVAQNYYRRGLWESATEWFSKALSWDPTSVIAAEGYVMSAFHAQQYHDAYQVCQSMATTHPSMKRQLLEEARGKVDLLMKNNQLAEAGAFLDHFPSEETGLEKSRERLQFLQSNPAIPADPRVIAAADQFIDQVEPSPSFQTGKISDPIQGAYIKAAREAYRTDQYESSLWNLEEAEKEAPLTRNAGLLRGWCLYRLGRHEESADLFEKLYKTQTDVESARGVVVSLRKKGDHERLGQLVGKWGGILAGESKAGETTAFDFDDTNLVSGD